MSKKPVADGDMWRVYAGICALAKLSGTDKAALAILVDYADDKGKAWPSEFTIADRLGIHVRRVGRSIAKLIRSPYVKRTRRMRTSNVYEIDFQAILSAWADCKSDRTETSDQEAVRSDTNVRSDCTETSDQTAQKRPTTRNNITRNKDQEQADAKIAFGEFVAMAVELGLSQPRDCTSKRLSSINARLSNHGGLEAWREALSEIRASSLLQGRNGDDRQWRVDLDWLTKPDNFVKVIEGNYRDRERREACRRSGQSLLQG